MDLHKFASCKYVANMGKLRNKYGAMMEKAMFAHQKTRGLNYEAGKDLCKSIFPSLPSNFSEIWTIVLGQFVCRFSVARDFIRPSCIQLCVWFVNIYEFLKFCVHRFLTVKSFEHTHITFFLPLKAHLLFMTQGTFIKIKLVLAAHYRTPVG